ncbi:MAG: BACON domain-containing protein [Bacteroidales bacterium]|nr:BACON domain-containing protein [Bacteroidales bacterium]
MKNSGYFAGIILSIILSLLLSSCLPGRGKDDIGLSQTTVVVDAKGGIIIVNTESGFEFDALYLMGQNGQFYQADNNAGKHMDGAELFLKGDWIEVRKTRNDPFSMQLTVEENTDPEDRQCKICIFNGNCSAAVDVRQEAMIL